MTQQLVTKKIITLLTIVCLIIYPVSPALAEEEASQSAESVPEPTPEPTPEPSPQPLPESDVDITATISATTKSLADTGQNTQIASEAATITTGPAIAIANNLIESNVTAHNSQLDSQITTNQVPDPPTIVNSSADSPLVTEQAASVTATTSAAANTGNNIIIAAGDASLITANAVAIANAIQLINLTLDNAEVYIYVSNISPDSDSILIFPRPELFAANINDQSSVSQPVLINQVDFVSSVSALAVTGNNVAISTDQNQLITGDAISLSQQINCINSLIEGSSFYFLSINHPLANFVTPTYQGSLNSVVSPFQTILTAGNINPPPDITQPNNHITGQASATSLVSASANTGNNYVEGVNTSVFTGVSLAITNSIQFINTQILNSRIFIGIVNFLGSWTGSAHFNYPDAAITLAADSNHVQATISNLGYDQAHQPQITINVAGQQSTFNLEDLAPNQTQTVSLPITVPASLTISADVTIVDPEINLENNHATATITVSAQTLSSDPATTSNNYPGNPLLSISATNNTVEPMNPGDIITFEIVINNTGDGDSPDTVLYHRIYDQFGNLLGSITLPLGNLATHQGGTLRFGVTIPSDNQWGGGQFFTQSQALGSVNSNIAATTFAINNHSGFIRPVQAAESLNPTVLGDTQANPPSTSNSSLLIAYVLLFLVSLQYLIKNAKVTTLIGGLLHVVALSAFLFSVYQVSTLTHLVQPITVIDDNYQLLAGKLRQFL